MTKAYYLKEVQVTNQRTAAQSHGTDGMDQLVRALALHISEEARRFERFVVAIDGPGCCGKSTLAERINALVEDCVQLCTDDFHLPRGSDSQSGSPLPYRRWKEFMESAVRLATGHSASFRPIDWTTRSLSPEVTILPGRVLLIEGIGAMHPSLASLVHYRAWVDGLAATRMARVRARDGAHEVPNWHKYIRFEQAYLESCRPWARADVWIYGAELDAASSAGSFSRLIDTNGFAVPSTR